MTLDEMLQPNEIPGGHAATGAVTDPLTMSARSGRDIDEHSVLDRVTADA